MKTNFKVASASIHKYCEAYIEMEILILDVAQYSLVRKWKPYFVTLFNNCIYMTEFNRKHR